ncbi:translocation/assembly module TamB domain-containing protein [Rickettsiella endosymbiont of Dermanyssus gallinae]|uniref:translocation/assembly module TamB domain-containing protein n=1 Tax=Rickettsiella endosymbiont of Dermanyssus gallinae TaxID=2856608 RepID=UPI001C52DFA2|nr:translocation/assembly module TamB domain-containing protein [Rickettsiella endosymbiont of Dermanyssus gallinae]
MTIRKFSSLRWIIFYSITLFFLSLGYLAVTTQKGLEIASQLTRHWLPGTLKITELNGRLLGPIQIKDLSYKDADTTLTISSVQFDWHWSALLHGQFSIASLSIDKLILAIKEQEKQKDSAASETTINDFQLPTFFKHIHLNSMDIKQSILRYGANTLSLDGSLHKQWNFNWQLTIPQLASLLSDSKGQLFLQGQINGNYSSPHFYLSLLKTNLSYLDWQLNQIQGSFDLDSLDSKKWLLDLKAVQFKNNTFSLNPVHISLNGSLQPFSLQGNLSGFKLSRKDETLVTHNLNIPSSQITAKLTPEGLAASLITNPSVADQLSAYIQLPHYKYSLEINPKQTIKANIQLTLKNLNYFSTFIPAVKNPQGALNTQLNLSGLLFSPSINGELNLKNTSTQIPLLGLYLKNMNLVLHTDKNVLQGSGRLDSGKGTLTFQSKTQLNQPEFPSLITLQGNNLEISHTREFKITASPSLQIQANTQRIEATGLIAFPKALIKINDNTFNGHELSNDVVFVNHKKETASLPFTYKNNIKLQLGDDIQFNYQGLRTKITGNLDINQTSDHPILATGVLSLTEGEYTYYGQSLKLQPHSLLSFANSPIDNPNIDVTANKNVWVLPKISTANNSGAPKSKLGSSSFISSALQTTQPIQATVGVRLQGYLENPKITLYANPTNAITSQLEILSYLVTGQPSDQLSAASMQLLLGAATQAGGEKTGVGHLINKAQKKMGIDQLTIGVNPIFNPNTNKLQQNTSLIIGKSFSPRLNVSYSLGLLDPISVLQINYLLNKNFSLQSTNSNFANGIDLLYKLEKN